MSSAAGVDRNRCLVRCQKGKIRIRDAHLLYLGTVLYHRSFIPLFPCSPLHLHPLYLLKFQLVVCLSEDTFRCFFSNCGKGRTLRIEKMGSRCHVDKDCLLPTMPLSCVSSPSASVVSTLHNYWVDDFRLRFLFSFLFTLTIYDPVPSQMGCFLSRLFQMKAEQICIFPRISETIADVVVFKLSLEAETLSDLNLSCSQKHGCSTQV